MRIALFTDGIWPDTIGGMQKHSFYLASYLAQKGVLVDLYYCSSKSDDAVPDFFDTEAKDKINFIKVPFPKMSLPLPGHYIRESYHYSKALYQAMNKQAPPDIIYAQGFTGWYTLKQDKRPLLGLNLHGVEMYQYTIGLRSKLQQWLLRIPARFCLSKADMVFSLGGRLTAIQQAIAKPGAVTETPIGIGPEWLTEHITPAGSKLKFVFVGRNERRKGLQELFEAIRILHSKHINRFECHFIGPVEGNIPGCIFHGELRDINSIKTILQRADILVCPSLAEGMPTVILEAMACGLGIIASDVGAVAMQVDKENGIVIPAGNAAALANAMETCISSDTAEINHYKIQSVARIRSRFLWDRVADITLEAIKARI